MFRNLLLSALLAITAVTGVALTADTASAYPPGYFQDQWRGPRRHERDNRHSYEVLYRHRNHWDSYGMFRDRDDAERAARRLRHQGYQVRIEVEHNHR